MMKRLEHLPVPILPTMVGAITLANVFNTLGFAFVRHLTVWAAIVVWLLYVVKIIVYPKTCLAEYKQTVPSSLYAGFTMIMMLVASYLYSYLPTFATILMYKAIAIHTIHIVIFTYCNMIKNREWATFVPSWYVTYNGILVSCVVGVGIVDPMVLKVLTVYGIIAYFGISPMMLYRLITKPIAEGVYLTQAILLAPASLCSVAYLNCFAHPSVYYEIVLYACVLCSLLFVLYKLPTFLNRKFHPGFAALTFPMAIGIVATQKMAVYVGEHHAQTIALCLQQLAGIQIYVTTAIIGYVLFKFLMMAKKQSK